MKVARYHNFIEKITNSKSSVFVFTSYPFDWIGKSISLATNSKTCHTGFIFKQNNNEIYVCDATFKKGVDWKIAYTKFSKRNVLMNVYDLKATPEQEQKIVDYCVSVTGQKYDFIGALTGIESKNRKYCSSLVIKALRYANYLQDANNTWRTTPADISQLLELKAM